MANDPRFTMTAVVNTSFGGDFSDLVAIDSNNLIATYVGYTNGGADHTLFFAFSTNGGTTWTPSQVDTTDGSLGQYTTVSIRSEDGVTIYIFYSLLDYGTPTNGSVKLAKSTNSGGSWTITTIQTGDLNNFAVSHPFMGGGELFFPIQNATTNDLSVAVSMDGGGSWSFTSVDPNGAGSGSAQVIGRGNKLMIAYGTGLSAAVKFGYSTDCGDSWTTTTVDTGTNLDAIAIGSLDGTTIWIFYQKATNFVVSKSTNGGTSWSPPVTIDAVGGATPGTPAVFIANSSEPVVAYGSPHNNSGGSTGGYGPSTSFAQSANGGTTWSVTNIAEYDGARWGLIQSIAAIDPSTFWILGVRSSGATWPVEIWKSNTSITGAFTAPTAFSCGPVIIHVLGEQATGPLVQGEDSLGALVQGEYVI